MPKKPPIKPRFITLEGIEGVGKSTHSKYIQRFLTARGIPFVLTREPGGTPIAEKLRKLVLSYHREIVPPVSELLMLFASRAQHVTNVIRPALAAGKWVICDRFTDTSYAYQGHGRGLPLEQIAVLEKWVQNDLHPDPVLLFDAPVKVALKRTQKRSSSDRIESEKTEFFEKARKGYLARAKKFPKRFRVIDASAPLNQVQQQIKQILIDLI